MGFWIRLKNYFGGNPTKDQSGQQSNGPSAYGNSTPKPVTEESALQLSAVWACVKILAETISSLPMSIHKIDGESSVIDRAHPLHALFTGKPNNYQTAMGFWETMLLNLFLHGNAYAQIGRSTRRINSLIPLSAAQMNVGVIDRGATQYVYCTDKGEFPFEQGQILHIKLLGSGRIGMSPLHYGRNTFGITQASEDHSGTFFANGAKPSGVVKFDKFLTADQREAARLKFADLHEGTANAHKLFILEGGMDFTATQINPEDAQLLETRRYQVEEICRFFGVPSILVNDSSNNTTWGSGIEQIMRGFYQVTIRPELERIEQTINCQLLTAAERTTHHAKFNFEELLRGDPQARAEYLRTMVANGLMTRNEARRKENLPQVEGGDELTVQTNLAPLDELRRISNE